jgi:hypothetical protein
MLHPAAIQPRPRFGARGRLPAVHRPFPTGATAPAQRTTTKSSPNRELPCLRLSVARLLPVLACEATMLADLPGRTFGQRSGNSVAFQPALGRAGQVAQQRGCRSRVAELVGALKGPKADGFELGSLAPHPL